MHSCDVGKMNLIMALGDTLEVFNALDNALKIALSKY